MDRNRSRYTPLLPGHPPARRGDLTAQGTDRLEPPPKVLQRFSDPQQREPFRKDVSEYRQAYEACLGDGLHRPPNDIRIAGQIRDVKLSSSFGKRSAERRYEGGNVRVRSEVDSLLV